VLWAWLWFVQGFRRRKISGSSTVSLIPSPVYLSELPGKPLALIDAGSDQRNPFCAIEQAPQGLPPLDAGTNIPNPV
jgi:hypothetical protein